MALAAICIGLTVLSYLAWPLLPSVYGQTRHGSARQGQSSGEDAGPLDASPKDEPTGLPEQPSMVERAIDSQKKSRTDDTKIIPSVTLSQRYDSNVLFAASGSQIGLTQWDFVTTASPTIQVINKNRYADSSLTAGVNGNLFVNNPDLNFVSTNLTGTTALDRTINRFFHGAKLQISDTFSFSPESPSFVSPADPVQTDNPFARGIVPVRANLYTNTVLLAGAYPVSPGFVLQGTYSYSFLRVGEIFVQQPVNAQAAFFNTDQHTWSLGPTWQVSRTDSFSVFYRSTSSSLSPTSGAFTAVDFQTHGAEGTYSTTSADWGAVVSAGATVLDLDNRAYWTGSLSLSRKVGQTTTFRVLGSRAFAPAFFATGGALISTNAGLSVDHRFSRSLLFTGSANYALNEVAPVEFVRFESYSATGLLSYNLSRTLAASVGYSYTYFEVSAPMAAATDLAGYIINRHVLTLSLTGTWK